MASADYEIPWATFSADFSDSPPSPDGRALTEHDSSGSVDIDCSTEQIILATEKGRSSEPSNDVTAIAEMERAIIKEVELVVRRTSNVFLPGNNCVMSVTSKCAVRMLLSL